MQVGLVLPQGYFNEFEGWEPDRAWARIVELAGTAERLGFESIWTGEHTLSKWPGESIAFDCWALSSALAPLVPRVGIGLIVMNSTFHNPAMTAGAAATLDAISGGRLTLGLGAGFKENEAAAFGHPYPGLRDRMELLTEHFEVIWRATRAETPAPDAPSLAGPPGVKLLIGGHGKNYTFRLAARYCERAQPERLPGRGPSLARGLPRAVRRDRARPEHGRAQLRHEPDHALQGHEGDRRAAVRRAARTGLPGSRRRWRRSGRGPRNCKPWRELGFDRITAGIPGLHNTDEGLYEFIEDCRTAGITFFDNAAGGVA